ncbi:hypothetical protein BJ138DRAFT_999925, partial [Hygrophoropsis aurantiaca]
WITCVHPEGALYFYHQSKRVYTDENLIKLAHLNTINQCVDELHEKARVSKIDTATAELVLERLGHNRYGYYFIEPRSHCPFWLEKQDAEELFNGVRGVKNLSHIKYAMEYQYWYSRYHCELFPHGHEIYEASLNNLRQMAMHATAERITSDTSLVPFSNEELGKIIDLLDYMKGDEVMFLFSLCLSKYSNEHLILLSLARFMRTFARTKFVNFHGQIGARLDADQTVYFNDKGRQSIVLKILSPLLFGAPDLHIKALKRNWVDQLVNYVRWKTFIETMNSEWKEFTLYATVVLNANVAFLALPDVTSQTTSASQSPAQIASYISIVTSIGSILLGLLLVRQNRTKDRDSAEDAANFMMKMTDSMITTETLAIIYSLPYALLMWGMVFFVLAFSLLAFEQTIASTRALVAFSELVVACFIICMIWLAHHAEPTSPGHASNAKPKSGAKPPPQAEP